MMRKIRLVIALTLVLCMCLSAAALAADTGFDGVLTIVHTNDVHGNEAVEPYVKGYVDSLRAAGGNVLLISAGDAFKGTPFASMTNGLDVATVMNMVGYDMFTIGNHEQMLGTELFGKIAEKVEFPILAANMKSEWLEAVPQIKDYVIKEFGGTKIAFIGITTPGSGGALTGADSIIASAERAKTAAEAEGATVFIGVTHLGVKDGNEQIRSTYLAGQCPWLAAIIDAHCHTAHENGLMQGDVLIAETGEYGNNIGVVELTFQAGKVTGKSAKLIPIKGKEEECGITPDAEVQAFIDSVNEKSAAYLSEVVATTPVDLDGAREFSRVKESNFGNVVSDAMRKAGNTDIAFVAGPYIRANIPAGDITREQLMQAMYEDVDLYSAEVPGQFIIDLMTSGVSNYPAEYNGFIHISGVKVEFSTDLGNSLVKVTMDDGSPFDPNLIYTCTFRSDNMRYMAGYDSWVLSDTICSAMIDYLNSGVVLSREVAGRIKPVEGSFSDLAGHWGEGAATEMLKAKNMGGFPDGTFRPDAEVTLAEFKDAAIAAFDMTEENATGIFPPFNVTEPVNRAAAALYLKRVADNLGIELPQGEAAAFSDIGTVSADAAEAITALQRGGIINGVGGGLYLPGNNVTRAQLATLISKLLANVPAAEAAA